MRVLKVKYATKYSGIIVGRAVMPIVHEGDALFHIAAVKSAGVADAAALGVVAAGAERAGAAGADPFVATLVAVLLLL